MCEKRYSLIVFLDEKEIERSETVQVDIVPTKWIFCDDHNKLVCPFINESTKDKINLLHKLVRENKPADSSWNNYRVEVRGTADTYKEGLEKLKILRTQAYAFSTDNEQHILKKQDSIKKQCRLKGMAKKKIKNKSLEDVGTFDLSTDDEMGNSISSQILADSDDNSSSNALSKKSTTSSDVQSYLQNPLPSWLKQSFDKLTYQIGTKQSELIIIKEELAEIKEIRTSVVRQVKEKQKKHDLNLPFNALNDFLLFDENLKTDKSLREEVKLFN
ncbi:uncharacterized protein LOC123302383 [Chrysoperla carnea]|uniref:uncharacterized protein LOC123302383 n=1 Tax=Chrysoperla carnea TaxID=189513 RepID=UPI001D063FE2|nr:uncharacterized protein LOC123302383 [Chrysoperla carnea]